MSESYTFLGRDRTAWQATCGETPYPKVDQWQKQADLTYTTLGLQHAARAHSIQGMQEGLDSSM